MLKMYSDLPDLNLQQHSKMFINRHANYMQLPPLTAFILVRFGNNQKLLPVCIYL